MPNFPVSVIYDISEEVFSRWLEDFDVLSAALSVVPGEPPILRPGRHISGPLDEAEEGTPALAGPITQPNVLPGLVDLVVEAMVDGKTQASGVVDLFHLGEEVRPMAVPAFVSRPLILSLSQEEPGVDQLM